MKIRPQRRLLLSLLLLTAGLPVLSAAALPDQDFTTDPADYEFSTLDPGATFSFYTVQHTITAGDPKTLVLGECVNNGGNVGAIPGWTIHDIVDGRFTYHYVIDGADVYRDSLIYAFSPSTLRFIPPTISYGPEISTSFSGSIEGVGLNSLWDFMWRSGTVLIDCSEEVSLPWGTRARLAVTFQTEDHHYSLRDRVFGYEFATIDLKGCPKPGTKLTPEWRDVRTINSLNNSGMYPLPVEPLTGVIRYDEWYLGYNG
ncbi:MAG TPA: hypothetical protein VEL07_17410 [Planctomycetota bacterium]|nr:hypothetical protein [Planctomycetota bacterium]